MNTLFKNSVVYSFFTLLQRAFGFILLPLYANFLTENEYGIVTIIIAAIPFCSLIIGFALRGSSNYYYYHYKGKNEERIKEIFGSNLVFILLVSVLSIIGIIVFYQHGTTTLLKNVAFYPYIFFALLSIATQPSYLFIQSIFKAKQMASLSSLLDFIYFVFIIIFTLIFLTILKLGAEGAILAISFANLLVLVISLFIVKKHLKFCLKPFLLKKSLRYSLPILPHNLSSWAMNLVDKIILNNLTTLTVVAAFDIGSQLGKVLNIITLGVNYAYSPWFFEIIKKKNPPLNLIANTTERLVLIYSVMALITSWLSPELIYILTGGKYEHSWLIVPIIAYAFVINGFYYCFSNVFFLDKTKYLPLVSISGAIFNIILNYIIIPIYGIVGAAFSSLLTKLLFTIIAYIISQRLTKIPYNKFKLFSYITFSALFSCLIYLVQPKLSEYSPLLIIIIKIIPLLIIFSVVLVLNRKSLKHLISKDL